MNESQIEQQSPSLICCKGGLQPYNHPAVYLQLGENGKITCPYCSQEFIADKDLSKNNLA